MGSGFVMEDDSGDEVTITEDKEVKFIGGTGITTNWTDVSHGSDGDPYDLTITNSGVTSIVAGDGIDISGATGAVTVTLETGAADNLGGVIIAEGGGIDVSYSSGTVTVTGEDASTSNKGIASFASANFAVSSGAVSISAVDGGTY